MRIIPFSIAASILLFSTLSHAEDAEKNSSLGSEETPVQDEGKSDKKSPWLVTPLISSNPKLSTTIGAMAGYMKTFDKKSQASMFGLTGNYSNTDSYTAVAFANTYFDKGNQRADAAIVSGKIYNDYDDYLGTGYPLKTTDSISVIYAKWAYQVYTNWFLGLQGVSTNYQIYSSDFIPGESFSNTNYTLQRDGDLAKIAGFQSNGLGLSIEFDSRDRPRSATKGQYFKVANIAYRESLGGDESFDSYRGEYNYYLEHDGGSVLAINVSGQYSSDAPIAAYASVKTKGYTTGQYLAPYASSIQIDERYSFNKSWGAVAYAAVTCLHGTIEGETLSCSDSENIYPSVSAGGFYAIKPEAGVVVRMEAAIGKDDNKGFYMSLGHPF